MYWNSSDTLNTAEDNQGKIIIQLLYKSLLHEGYEKVHRGVLHKFNSKRTAIL